MYNYFMKHGVLSHQWSRRLVRWVLRDLIRVGFLLLTRLTIEGREQLPEKGPILIVANHFHFADPVAIIRAMPWLLDFIGGLQMPFAPNGVKWLAWLWGTFRVHRQGSSRAALEQGEAVLSDGGILGIFPEGGSWAAVLRPPRPGAAYLATRTGAIVVPVGLIGMTDMFSLFRCGHRAQVTVRIGEQVGPFPPVPRGRGGREQIDRIGEQLMKGIAVLLPPEKRGVYSEEPALREAAEEVAAYPWEGAKGVNL